MIDIIERIKKEFILFSIGGSVYFFIEIFARGYSHWSMFLVGGICFILIGEINEHFDWEQPTFVVQMLLGGLIITALELLSGYILNIKLGWNIWDYSNEPFNFLGQICLSHSIIWIALSAVGIVLDDFIRYVYFDEEKPHYKFI